MSGDNIILVGKLGRTLPTDPRHEPAAQKNAAEVRKHLAAKALEKVPDGIDPHDHIAEAAIDPCFSASDEEWQAAFPGQRVHRRVPNRQRLQMHFAKAMCRAVARGDIELACVYFARLYGVPRPRSTTKGGKQ